MSYQAFSVPTGRIQSLHANPALKRRAIIRPPFGEFGERRYQLKCYTPMLNTKCRLLNADCLQGKGTLEDVAALSARLLSADY